MRSDVKAIVDLRRSGKIIKIFKFEAVDKVYILSLPFIKLAHVFSVIERHHVLLGSCISFAYCHAVCCC